MRYGGKVYCSRKQWEPSMGLELIKSKYKYLVANNIPCLNIPIHLGLKMLGTY